MTAKILLCTVGTSLLNRDNFGGRHTADGATHWRSVSADLASAQTNERACGAEINSVSSLIANGYAPPDAGIYLFHSDTVPGREIASVLVEAFRTRGHTPVVAVPILDLQDEDPKRFRTKGLRNLAKAICGKVREHTAAACAINATGGYKAQIAVAVLLGQAIGIPVYYMHEKFSEIIPFPPLPISLDFQVWMRASGLLSALEREPLLKSSFHDEWEEKFESLVNVETVDGVEYLELSPTGQIFHETFRERFRSERDRVLPPPAAKKHEPHFEKAGWPGTFPDAVRFVERLTREVPFVCRCATHYYNPDLAAPTRFRLGREGIEGVYSNGGRTMKFNVETTASTSGQRDSALAALNEWLDNS